MGDYLQIMHVSNQLAQNIATCGNQIQSVGGDLEAAVEIFHRGSETIKKGLTRCGRGPDRKANIGGHNYEWGVSCMRPLKSASC